MKNKLKTIILTIVCILAMPIIVNADMGAPESYRYEVIITNPNGAPLYDWDGKKTGDVIPFDTKIKIGLEYSINGELYVDVYYDDASGYGELEGMIKFSDAKLYSEEIDFSELSPNEDKHQYYAIEDTELYKGPSTVYGKIENVKIPAGTTIDYTYSSDYDYNMWAYTEYNGTKGWIYTFSMQSMSPYDIKSTVVSVSKGKVLIIGDQDVRDHKGNVVGKVKDNEEYEYIYCRSPEPKSSEYYIKTDKVEGWIGSTYFYGVTNGVAYYDEDEYLVVKKEGLDLYEDYKLTKKVNDLKIPYGTEYKTFYHVGTELDIKDENDENKIIEAEQVEYNGKKYWINYGTGEDEEHSVYYSSDYTITTKEELQLYKYQDETETLNVNIPADTELKAKWEISEGFYSTISWYYVEYEGTKGWIKIDSSSNETEVEEIVEPSEEEEEIPEQEETKEEDKKDKSLTPKQTAFIAIGAAVLLAIGALVTILLINKNKKAKQEKTEVKEDNIPNEEEKTTEEVKEEKDNK